MLHVTERKGQGLPTDKTPARMIVTRDACGTTEWQWTTLAGSTCVYVAGLLQEMAMLENELRSLKP